LGNPYKFQDTHSHLLKIAHSKDASGNDTLRVFSCPNRRATSVESGSSPGRTQARRPRPRPR
jgi:hypothetical protein